MFELPQVIGAYVQIPSHDLEQLRELNRQGFWIESGTQQCYFMRRDFDGRNHRD